MYTMLLLVAVALILFLTWKLMERRPPNFPPGPIGFPLVGHLPLLGPKAHKTLLRWKKMYGPVIGVWFGSHRCVVLNDAKSIREAAGLDAFAGRPNLPLFNTRSGGIPKGITFNEGNHWSEQRRFTIRYLRNFVLGSSSMEAKIQEEIIELIESLKTIPRKPLQVTHLFHVAIINALWSILFGERMDMEDPKTLKAIPALTSLFNETGFLARLSILLPWMNRISPKLSGFEKIMSNEASLKTFLQEQMRKHQNNYVPNQPGDFIDAYTDQVRKTADHQSSFHANQEQILFTLLDLFLAGADTTSTTLSWALAYLVRYRSVQEKLQEEIDEIIGQERLPTLADRQSMPYIEAVINEVLRMSSLAHFALFHNAKKDVEFRGYFIPKDTMIITNLYSAHFDEDVWGDPQNFRPERFLDENRNFKRRENLLAFSAGKRACIGVGLARNELFLFITHLFQVFTASAAGKIPNLEPVVGLTLSPPPFDIILELR